VTKHLLLVAGIIGLLGIFAPLFSVGRGPLRIGVSAKELSFGLERTHDLINKKLPNIVESHLPPDVRETRDDVKLVINGAHHAVLAYVPALLLLVLGIVGLVRKRVGWIMGAGAILLSVASIVSWFGLRYGLAYGMAEEPILKRTDMTLENGAHALVLAGVVGLLGGVLAIVRRERAPIPAESLRRD
jgi:hypothetical protein